MREKLFDFIFSFGMMLAGVLLLFLSPISFNAKKEFRGIFPASGARAEIGGDLSLIFPPSKPAVPFLKSGNISAPPNLSAISAIAIDGNTKSILFEKNINEVRSLASITKLMTAMALLDLPIDWSSTAKVGESDFDGSDHHINVGEVYSLNDLWHIALVGSSNTAMNLLVRSSGLSEEHFVELMNRKAKELRLFSARFSEPTGLSAKNMANAIDAAKLLRDALRFDKIFTTLQIGEYFAKPIGTSKSKQVWSTNWLLTNWVPNNFKVEDIAGKTGFINDSKYNFAVSLTNKDKRQIIVVVMGANSNEERFSEARDVAEWAFENYIWPDKNI
ncbi:MAG: serine hydrolase [Patescibacteria group bacterium]